MSLDKEKYIGVVRTEQLSEQDGSFSRDIKHEVTLAKDELNKIFHHSTKILPKNFELPEIDIKNILGDNHVQILSSHNCKEKFCLIIFSNFILNNTKIDWVVDNEIRFIIEYVVTDKEISWEESTNNYSARVNGRFDALKEVFLDIFMDTIIEDSLSKHRDFKSLFNNKTIFNNIHSRSKVNFINKNYPERININLNYYSFASIFKNSSEEKYDVKGLLCFWQKYLLELNGQLINLRKVSSLKDIKEIIPKKFRGQFNEQSFLKLFSEKCKNKGLYYYVLLIKSPIGSTSEIISQLRSIFGWKPKIGNFTIIPFSFVHMLNGIEHLISKDVFEKE